MVGEVDEQHVQLLAGDVLPHVELGPIGDRKGADVLALADAPVVERPQLGPLVLGIPLAEVVPEREHPLLGPRLLLVPSRASEGGVEATFGQHPQQRRRLQPVAARLVPVLLRHPPGVDVVLHRGDDQPLTQLGHAAVAELERLGKVVAGVDVEDGEREPPGTERLLGDAQQHDRVLAAAEQQHRTLQLGRHLAHDEDGLRLQRVEVGQLEEMAPVVEKRHWCSPHSVLSDPAHRPDRGSAPGATGVVVGAQPIDW